MTDRTDLPPPLSADDPRISEWLDGRLPAAEAAAIERAVRASPALVALAADLRAMKAAARMVTTVAPPADFADRVLEAIATGAGRPDSDRTVDDEWQAIEAERIAEERAEAAADVEGAAHEPASARRWPWLALAGALAAGLLVTLVLNRPGDDKREVALVEPEAAARRERTGRADLDRADLDRANVDEARQVAARARGLSSVPAAATPPAPAVRALERRASAGNVADGALEGGPPLTRAAAAPSTQARNQPAPRVAAEAVAGSAGPLPIEVVVWGAEGRAALARRIEALGLVATPAQPFGSTPDREAGSQVDLLEIVGSREAIATLLAEVAGWEPSADQAAEKKGVEGIVAEEPDVALVGRGRAVIRIIEEEGPPQAPAER